MLTVKEYEQELRTKDLSESDIEFLLDVYKQHLAANGVQYADFAESALKDNMCREDIATAIDAIEKNRYRPERKVTSIEPISAEESAEIANFIDYLKDRKQNNLKGC